MLRRGYEDFALFGFAGANYADAALDSDVGSWHNRSRRWSAGSDNECQTTSVLYLLHGAFTIHGRHCLLRHERNAFFYEQRCPPDARGEFVGNRSVSRKDCNTINAVVDQ